MEIERVVFHLDIVDTAGQVRRRTLCAWRGVVTRSVFVQDEYSQLPKEASIGVHGYVLVFDSSSRDSFMQVRVCCFGPLCAALHILCPAAGSKHS